jgi:hypothetical protein
MRERSERKTRISNGSSRSKKARLNWTGVDCRAKGGASMLASSSWVCEVSDVGGVHRFHVSASILAGADGGSFRLRLAYTVFAKFQTW